MISIARSCITIVGTSLAATLMSSTLAWPQQTANAAAFEVASVRRNDSGAIASGLDFQAGGRIIATNLTARGLIRMAFPDYREIIGAPEWIATERYDVNATAGRDASRGEINAMIRTLLEERFQLRAHVEARQQDGFALVSARSDRQLGPGLMPSTQDCDAALRQLQRGGEPLAPNGSPACGVTESAGVHRASGQTMSSIAGLVQRSIGKPVVDRTGLTGRFDYTVRYSPDPERPIGDHPSIVTAVQEQLGLRLEPASVPVEVLVIDHVERPSPN